MASAGNQFASYREFWPHYVGEHREPATRWLHFVGTTSSLLLVVAAIVLSPWFLLPVPVVAYGFAWGAHFLFERNTPATFDHPFYSIVADLHMYGLMWLGRMEAEVRKHKDGRSDGASTP